MVDFDLNSLFQIRESEDEIFYFNDIFIELNNEDSSKLSNFTSKVHFKYSYCDEIDFTSSLIIDGTLEKNNFHTLFCIGMCVLPWYWMAFGTSRIVIQASAAKYCFCEDEKQLNEVVNFWKNFFDELFLEYFYVNKICKSSMNLTFQKNVWEKVEVSSSFHIRGEVLVPLGGGKDSLVALYLSMQEGLSPHLLYVADGFSEYENSWRLKAIVKASDCKLQLVCHDFNYKSIQKHCKSFLKPCGHPWAALVYFDALLISQLRNIPLVYLGHEKSADEGNGVYVNGVEVNHQYDKSTAFLHMASEYVAKHITPNVQILSAVKSMWEIEICRIFCLDESLKKYHHLFISCNEVSEDFPCEWCKKCEKCAFIFLLMSAWMDISYVTNTVFGGVNMLADEGDEMLGIFLSLLGRGKSEGKKPFECVGTVREASAAVHLAVERILPIECDVSNINDRMKRNGVEIPKILKILWEFCPTDESEWLKELNPN